MALIDRLLEGRITASQKRVLDIIVSTARDLEVDPCLAVSIAILESGLNPKTVGDNGTSFGLYQLHVGGELGSMPSDRAFDPVINTTIALRVLHGVDPEITNPGDRAAAAQRPRYPKLYALAVNTIYPLVKRFYENSYGQ